EGDKVDSYQNQNLESLAIAWKDFREKTGDSKLGLEDIKYETKQVAVNQQEGDTLKRETVYFYTTKKTTNQKDWTEMQVNKDGTKTITTYKNGLRTESEAYSLNEDKQRILTNNYFFEDKDRKGDVVSVVTNADTKTIQERQEFVDVFNNLGNKEAEKIGLSSYYFSINPNDGKITLERNYLGGGYNSLVFEKKDAYWVYDRGYIDEDLHAGYAFSEDGKVYEVSLDDSGSVETLGNEITDPALTTPIKRIVGASSKPLNSNLPTTTPTTTPAIDLSIPFYKRNIYTEAEAQGIAILTKKLTWGMLNLLLENFAYKFIDKMCIKDKGKSSHSGGRASNTSLITNSTNSTTNNQTIV
ncbi:MAG: hypothetical protein KKE50_05595, partial [Nanoarchaeota archaeon]|nr:hypothetical protein [Nanoarchaeota archaeon]